MEKAVSDIDDVEIGYKALKKRVEEMSGKKVISE